jgi:hypothetical protein
MANWEGNQAVRKYIFSNIIACCTQMVHRWEELAGSNGLLGLLGL